MNIGIIGTGSVGSALAAGLTAASHDVVLGSRDPDAARGHDITVTTQQSAADHGDIVVLALSARIVAGAKDFDEFCKWID